VGVWSVNYTVQDSEGDKSVVGFYLPGTETLTAVEEFASGMFAFLDAMILGGVVACNVSKAVDVVGIPSAIGASDVEVGAVFIFVTDGGYFTRVRVPTFDVATFIPSNSSDVNVALAPVANFIGEMKLGGGPGSQPSDYRGDDIVELSSAKESYQRQRR
jgi:hypothetical protein